MQPIDEQLTMMIASCGKFGHVRRPGPNRCRVREEQREQQTGHVSLHSLQDSRLDPAATRPYSYIFVSMRISTV